MKFEPNKTYVMRRHTGPTKTLVLSGEQSDPYEKGGFTHTARKAVGWAERYGDECGGVSVGVISLPMIGKDDTIYGILLDEFELERAISVHEFKRGLGKRLTAERSKYCKL